MDIYGLKHRMFFLCTSLLSLGLYQWSDKVIKRATRLWDIRGGRMVRHNVHLLVTPRVVVSFFFFKETPSEPDINQCLLNIRKAK